VVAAGDAVTAAVLVALKPVAGLHVYVVAPLAVKPTLLPEHIDAEPGVTVTVGDGAIVTTTVFVLVHEPLVPVTVYVVVVAGFAVTDAVLVALKPVAGAHV
jgi:hypothetical protein